ncbi:MAG: hypothetical protein ABJA77_15170 [Variovorax sp.]
MSVHRIASLAVAAALLASTAAMAQQDTGSSAPYTPTSLSPALDRFSLSVGAFYAEPSVNIGIGTPYGSYDSGKITGDRVALPRISADLLLFESQGLSFDYFRYSKDYSTSFANAYSLGPFGGLGVAGGANLALKLEFAKLSYRWWFSSGNTAIGAGVGAAYYGIKSETGAFGSLAGFGTSYGDSFSRTDGDSAVAPLLEVGVRHAFTPDFRLFADASGVRKGGGGVHGNIYNAQVGLEYFPVRNVGVALAYGVTDVDLKRDDYGLTRFRLKLQGPTLSLKARF